MLGWMLGGALENVFLLMTGLTPSFGAFVGKMDNGQSLLLCLENTYLSLSVTALNLNKCLLSNPLFQMILIS